MQPQNRLKLSYGNKSHYSGHPWGRDYDCKKLGAGAGWGGWGGGGCAW